MNRREVVTGAAGCIAVAGIGAARIRSASPQVPKRSRDLAGQSVNVRDYCAADGRQIDSEPYQALLDLRPASIHYPDGCILTLDRPIALRANQQHVFGTNTRIEAETDGFALAALGLTGQNLGSLGRPIARYTRTIGLDAPTDLKAGDIVVLADVSDPASIRTDINVIAVVDDNILTTVYPIGRPFAVQGFRLYHVYAPTQNLVFDGPVHATNHHPTGGLLRFVYTSGVRVSRLMIDRTGYIGVSFENSLAGTFENLTTNRTGASGLGFRSSKKIAIDGFSAKDVRSDESLTFFDNVSNAKITNVKIHQYIYSEKHDGEAAGNNILIDNECSRINMKSIFCTGSTTYNFMINNQSEYCSVSDFFLIKSNLGGIRISDRSNYNRIGKGRISDVRDMVDSEAKKIVSGVSIGDTCIGTTIADDVVVDQVASGLRMLKWNDAHPRR